MTKQVTTDDLYRRSTQYNNWSYTKEALKQKREETHQKAIKEAQEKLANAIPQSEIPDQFKTCINETILEPPSVEEAKQFLQYYTKNLLETGDFYRMPTQVKATAAQFFKRFYLEKSVMQFHPKHVLYTCLFLAAKSENYFMSIESFVKPLPKTEPHHVLDLEFIILQGLKFTLFVHHPFRPLYGLFLDMQAVLYDEKVDVLGALYDNSKKWLMEHALLSDVYFLYTPPQIALAAMYDTNKTVVVKYLKRKFPKKEIVNEAPSQEETKQPQDQNQVQQNPPSQSNSDVQKQQPNKSETTNENSNEEAEQTKQYDKYFDYQKLGDTIISCVKEAKLNQVPTREESTSIDKKLYFVMNPQRLIKRKIKQLST